MARPERCRDAAQTRARILTVARALFSERGFDATTVRAVAARAEVAPNLITRYFGGKRGLFDAARSLDLGVAEITRGPRPELGQRIAANVVRRWEAASPCDPLLMMLRGVGSSDQLAGDLADFFAGQAIGPLSEALAPEGGAEERVAGVAALILGVVTMRYVLRLGPLASATPADLTAWLGDQLTVLLETRPPALGVGGALPVDAAALSG